VLWLYITCAGRRSSLNNERLAFIGTLRILTCMLVVSQKVQFQVQMSALLLVAS